MPLFPDEFPFKKPPVPSAVQPAAAQPASAQAATAPPQPEPQAATPIPLEPEETIAPPPQAAPVAVPQERRRSPRQALIARAILKNEIGNAPGWKVDLLNMSMLGIRLRSLHSLTVGDKAFVKLEVGPLRWATKLRVIHCQALETGEFAIGCEFVANELARPLARAA